MQPGTRHPGRRDHVLLLLALALRMQQVQTGSSTEHHRRGRAYHYQVYVPADYQTKPTWPAILFLHGQGSGATTACCRRTSASPRIRRIRRAIPRSWSFRRCARFAVGRGSRRHCVAALQQTMREFHVDRIASTSPASRWRTRHVVRCVQASELFAAIVPICAGAKVAQFKGSVPAVPEIGRVMPALAQRLAKVSVWIFHGEMDQVVPVNGSREPAAASSGRATCTNGAPGLEPQFWMPRTRRGIPELVFAQQRR